MIKTVILLSYIARTGLFGGLPAVVYEEPTVVTIYAEPYIGRPLYCDRGEGLTYEVDETTEPWVALPVSEYGTSWACGDLIYLSGTDAAGEPWALQARALDAGPLARYCVLLDDPAWGEVCAPIVADIPEPFAPFAGLSARVDWMMNVSAAAREYGLVSGGGGNDGNE